MVMSSQKPAFRDHCRGRVFELIHGIIVMSWSQCNIVPNRMQFLALPYLRTYGCSYRTRTYGRTDIETRKK